MEKAVMLAKIQQTIQEKAKAKLSKTTSTFRQSSSFPPRYDQKGVNNNQQLVKERQVRDYCRTNNLCSIVENHMMLLMLPSALKDPRAKLMRCHK
jgi:hypothetical protein